MESVAGMAAKSAQAFVAHIPDMVAFLKEADLMDKIKPPEKKQYDTSNPLYAKNVVLTGSRAKDIVSYLESVGANVTSSVNKSTNLLIKKDEHYTSSSVEAAEAAGIPVITVDAFKTAFM